MTRSLKAPIPPIALKPTAAAAAMGVGETFFNEEIAPDLRVIRRGRVRLFPVAELERWADEHAEKTLGDRS